MFSLLISNVVVSTNNFFLSPIFSFFRVFYRLSFVVQSCIGCTSIIIDSFYVLFRSFVGGSTLCLHCKMATFCAEGKPKLTILSDDYGIAHVIENAYMQCLLSNLELCIFPKTMHMMTTTML